MSIRTHWFARTLQIKDEPLIKSLIEYRLHKDRTRIRDNPMRAYPSRANLISSITRDGKQMPILDLDFPHHVIESTTDGHTHLYLDVPISYWRWVALMIGLRLGGVIELGFFVWSLRRGGNFVRIPGTVKSGEGEQTKPTYGWFRKLK